jgi:hypothetical protein
MPDEFGGSRPDDPEDWQQFMLGMFDLIEEARSIEVSESALDLLEEARQHLLTEFERKFPGYGKGRAVW